VTEISVSAGQRMDGVDPARLWAFVANPKNISDWAPVRAAGFIGTEVPGVGHTLFLHRRRGARNERAWRCRIQAWEAGHRVTCALETPGAATEQRLELTVGTHGTGDHPAASVRVAYRGDVPRLLAWFYRRRIAQLERRAIRRILGAMVPT